MFQPLFWEFIRLVCMTVMAVIWGMRIVHGRRVPLRGPLLLLSNHQSFLDPVFAVCGIYRQVSFMARANLFDVPGLAGLIRMLNAFPVTRGTADLGAIKETIRRLKAGWAVLVFPEGTRTEDGSIGPFLPGAILPAKKCGAAVVPMAIDGAFECWPRDRKLPSPGSVRVIYGRPIPAERVEALAPEELLEQVRGAILELHGTLRRMRGR
jgi:1-acyl-sn-glycerol-3-phosphate acyltransferase